MICQVTGGLGTGIIIGFIYSWQITLCVLGFAPFLLVGGILSQRIITGSNASNKSAMELAAKVGALCCNYIYCLLVFKVNRKRILMHNFDGFHIDINHAFFKKKAVLE